MQLSAIPTLGVGSVIAETYSIEALIGRGGMGQVFLASHARLPGKQVAIKMLHADMTTEEMLARFRREAHIASRLAHPNIVHIEDFNVTPEGTPYLVLEYLQGESLAQRLTRGPIAIEAAMSIVRQIGSALAAAHAKGIIHRDLKPPNIYLVPSEQTELVKVLDFGISKLIDAPTVSTEKDALLGTPQYMAPEQANVEHDKIDARTDVFALGSIVYEMLAGRPAFTGSTIPEVVFKVVYEEPPPLPPEVPEAVAAAIRQAMAKRPDDRFASVSGFVEALTGKRISVPVGGLPQTANPFALAPTVDSDRRMPKRRPIALYVAAAVATFALAGGVTYFVMRSTPRTLDRATLQDIAAHLEDGTAAVIDGKTYPVTQTTRDHLKNLKFTFNNHRYEAIEQNAEKDSRYGKLARDGHRVVQFRDLGTNNYFAVVVDGQAE